MPMRTKTTLAAILVVPLLVIACNRADHSPTAAAPGQSQEKQAMSPDKMLERSPPAAGPSTPSTQPAPGQSSSPSTDAKPNLQPPDDTKKTN